MKKLAMALAVLAAGCATQNKVEVITAGEWEKSYTAKDEILVNGKKIEVRKDDVVWMLSGKTFYKLLKDSTDGAK